MSTPRFPRIFGKYVLLRPFAKGGMGELFIAASGDLGGAEKLCLVKKVAEERDSPGMTGRLLDEARVAVRLNHTNLVQVFDCGTVDDELYIAMELIEGRDLRAVWNRTAEKRSHIPLDVALYIVREMARGLDYAHNYGGLTLVHRDIAPPNILLSWHGTVKLTDFGLARSTLKNERTAPGIVYGRVAYLAPEQARGEQADPRTDIYAAGVILWELLTGRPLLEPGEDSLKALERARHPNVQPPSSITKGLPPGIDQAVMKALAPDRNLRFQTADDFRKAIASELARIAPGTDSSRLAAFMRELFVDEMGREERERDRLLAEELPKVRQKPAERPAPVAQKHHTDPSLPVIDEPPARPPPPRRPPSIPMSAKLKAPPGVTRALAAHPPAGDDALSDFDADALTMSRAPAPSRVQPAKPKPFVEDIEDLDPDSDPQIASLVGQLVDGRYQVERLLGTGGMGAVYEAEHMEIGKKVAVKVLHPQYSRQADLVARFRREARAASRVGHPNIVDVTDSGTTENGDVFFVMELLEGLDLGEVLRHERRVATDRTVHIGTQICRALSAAHAAGIIHRDLKPENVFLCARDGNADFVKVVDFGIAKHDMGNQNHPRRLTTPGIAMGTPEYMAPEQAAGKSIDGRVDIYSVGAILYEMLTGDPPHHGSNVMEILQKKATETPVAPRKLNADVSEALDRVVMRCLERNPDDRPQTMSELEYELTKSQKGRGSAVALMLGLKAGADPDPSSPVNWAPMSESQKASLFDATTVSLKGNTGAAPLEADDGPVRVAEPSPPAPQVTNQTNSVAAIPQGGGGGAGWVVALVLLAVMVGGGAWAWQTQPEVRKLVASIIGGKTKSSTPDSKLPTSADPKAPDSDPIAAAGTDGGNDVSNSDGGAAPVVAPAVATPDKLAPGEVERLLEWAKRCAEGGRVVVPPGDNLKELLDRIQKAEPDNAGAKALREKTIAGLQKKSALAVRRARVEEAVPLLEGLIALNPDDNKSKQALARSLSLRAEHLLSKRKVQAALVDVNTAIEINPDLTAARVTRAEIYLSRGQAVEAADEYQRILDGKPADKRAQKGLLAASRAKALLKKKKK